MTMIKTTSQHLHQHCHHHHQQRQQQQLLGPTEAIRCSSTVVRSLYWFQRQSRKHAGGRCIMADLLGCLYHRGKILLSVQTLFASPTCNANGIRLIITPIFSDRFVLCAREHVPADTLFLPVYSTFLCRGVHDGGTPKSFGNSRLHAGGCYHRSTGTASGTVAGLRKNNKHISE